MFNPRRVLNVLLPVCLLLVTVGSAIGADQQVPADVELLKQFRAEQNHYNRWQDITAQSSDNVPSASQSELLRDTQANRRRLERGPRLQDRSQIGLHAIEPADHHQIRETREVMYGSGEMSLVPDSLYFNYLLGILGSDTLNMDVMISSNEGTNFGSENAWIDGVTYPDFDDPSLLHFYSTSGSLDTVSMVPTINDPIAQWTDISWDWQGGNNGQPLAVGNLWVIYTRTSNMYVVMEVTDVHPWDSWFAFDYMIQTDGSNVFDGEPPMIFMSVNGGPGADLPIGSNPYFDIDLFGADGGNLYVLWDRNHDGLPSADDIPVQEFSFMDNDMNDENPDPDYFSFTYNDEMADGLNYVSDDFVFQVVGNNGAMASVDVSFFMNTGFTMGATGHVYDDDTDEPLDGVVVWIDYAGDIPEEPGREDDGPMLIDITDEFGAYTLLVPDSGLYVVGSFDHLGVTDGLVPDPNHQLVYIDQIVDGIDFYYREPETTIEGTVTDQFENPLEGVQLRIDGDDFELTAETDESGYYSVGVDHGTYYVDIDPYSIVPGYMAPGEGQEITTGDFVANVVDFQLLVTNSSISGTVYLDGSPLPNMLVWAWDDVVGFSFTQTDEVGDYVVAVYSGDIETYYTLGVDNEDPSILQVSENYEVMAGSTDEDILLETVTGGMEGYFINSENGEPIVEDWWVGMSARSLDGDREEYYTNPEYETGYYYLPLPDGLYELTAGGELWMGMPPDTILIDGEVEYYDVLLEPYQYDGIVDGIVRDSWGNPIPGAVIEIGNPMYGDMRYADEEGYFHFDLPNGQYGVHVWMPGYLDWWGEVWVDNDYTWLEIYLDQVSINGAIYGMVHDETGAPIPGADVSFYHFGQNINFHALTEEDGSYWVDVPNGVFDVMAHAPGYLEYYDPELWVNNDTIEYNIQLESADAAVYGMISDAENGGPIPWAGVMLVDQADSMNVYFGGTDYDGQYYIPVTSGAYSLYADAPGYEPVYFPDLAIDDMDLEFNFTMQPMQFAQPPHINFVMDQWDDQGRWARLQFDAGGTMEGPFNGFSIWRGTQFQDGYIWDYVNYVANNDMPAYNVVAPTLVDSNAHNTGTDLYWSTFIVTGHRGEWGFWDSEPVAGYSIDNIHPMVPGNLMIHDYGDDFIALAWDAPVDDDFDHYLLYRSLDGDFTGVTPMPLASHDYTDNDVEIGNTYYYMVSSVDANGNHSDGSDVVSTTIVSVEEARGVPSDFVLEPNYPNPFNPSTTITFGLPHTSRVVLEVYNIMGQKVRTLVNETMSEGYITTSWDGLDQNGSLVPSGTYIYRLRTPGYTTSSKMVLLR